MHLEPYPCDRPFGTDTPVIYFAQAGDDGPIKIGYCAKSGGVRKRMAELQTGCPWPIRIRRVMEAPHRIQTEFELHRKFAAYRMAGEWFMPAPVLALFAQANEGTVGVESLTQAAFERGVAAGRSAGEDEAYQRVARELLDLARGYTGEDLEIEISRNTAGSGVAT